MKYDIIYADPPWRYNDVGCNGAVERRRIRARQVKRMTDEPGNVLFDMSESTKPEDPAGRISGHYRTMSLDEIKSLPVSDIASDNSILFMWATWPLLPEALQVVSAWGFTYKSIGFLWVKKNRTDNGYFFGLGRWTRGNSEVCLLATRGKPKRVSQAVEQLCFEPIEGHSRKPAEIRHKIVELMGDLPRVELFARDTANGWDSWGDQVKCSFEFSPSAVDKSMVDI